MYQIHWASITGDERAGDAGNRVRMKTRNPENLPTHELLLDEPSCPQVRCLMANPADGVTSVNDKLRWIVSSGSVNGSLVLAEVKGPPGMKRKESK
jgi:hypothetical protein